MLVEHGMRQDTPACLAMFQHTVTHSLGQGKQYLIGYNELCLTLELGQKPRMDPGIREWPGDRPVFPEALTRLWSI